MMDQQLEREAVMKLSSAVQAVEHGAKQCSLQVCLCLPLPLERSNS